MNTPAAIGLDPLGQVTMRFTNIRNGNLDVTIRARSGRRRLADGGHAGANTRLTGDEVRAQITVRLWD